MKLPRLSHLTEYMCEWVESPTIYIFVQSQKGEDFNDLGNRKGYWDTYVPSKVNQQLRAQHPLCPFRMPPSPISDWLGSEQVEAKTWSEGETPCLNLDMRNPVGGPKQPSSAHSHSRHHCLMSHSQNSQMHEVHCFISFLIFFFLSLS